MRLQAHHPVGERVIPLVDQQLQPQKLAAGFGHLAAAFDQKIIVHPDIRAAGVRMAKCLVLGDFIRVMNFAVVDPAGVDVERKTK